MPLTRTITCLHAILYLPFCANLHHRLQRCANSSFFLNEKWSQSLVFGSGEERSRREEIKLQDIQRRWVASNRWAEAAQFALARSLTSSHSDLLVLEAAEGNNILRRTKDAVITLQSVLEGKHNTEIDETLNQYQVPADRWWSSLYKVIEGMVVSNTHVFDKALIAFFQSCFGLCINYSVCKNPSNMIFW